MGAVADVEPAPTEARRRRSPVAAGLRLIHRLGRWAAKRPDRVDRAYFVQKDGHVAVVVVGKADTYDFALSLELLDFLATPIATGAVGDVMLFGACSDDELAAFFDPRLALRVPVG